MAGPARRLPFNLGRAGQVQRAAGVKVEEEQGCLGVDREVAEGVEEVVTRVIPPPEPVAFDADEPGRAAPVGGV